MGYFTAWAAHAREGDARSLVFKHPVRIDPETDQVGLEIVHHVGTLDPETMNSLVQQVNALLSTEEYWDTAKRPDAAKFFDPRAIAAFYDTEPQPVTLTSKDLREQHIPLPTVLDGYRRVLLIGTTGAGKTTVIRQMLGTDPVKDRFPSTSTAKTTVSDTEVVLTDGSFRAIVTFCSRKQVLEHLADNASRAALTVSKNVSESEIRSILLDHQNQRFRFSYVLGRHDGPRSESDADDFDDFDDISTPAAAINDFDSEPALLDGIDLDVTAKTIDDAVSTLRELARHHLTAVRDELDATTEDDERALADLLDEGVEERLRADPAFADVLDSLTGEILTRFDFVSNGEITRDPSGWPLTWTLQSEDRTHFLRSVNRFTSNYAPLFGHLLSPLVDGIRVAGPFHPTWISGSIPKLVLIDGEGLGHTPKSSSAIPTATAKLINEVDAVLLVDNAEQPVQAAPAAAIRSILTSGNSDKLIFCFTHFEGVQGDNLSTPKDRVQHVIHSVENVLSAIKQDFGVRAEQALKRRLDKNRIFLAGIDKKLTNDDPAHLQSIGQFTKLFTMIENGTQRIELGPARPVYPKSDLIDAIADGTASFHHRWQVALGLETEPGVAAEHWSRIKALSRRFAETDEVHYGTLRPTADLREFIKADIYKVLGNPTEWRGQRATDESVVTAPIDSFAQEIAIGIESPILNRLATQAKPSWKTGSEFSGAKSTVKRAHYIAEDVFSQQVPQERSSSDADSGTFLAEVVLCVETAAAKVGVILT